MKILMFLVKKWRYFGYNDIRNISEGCRNVLLTFLKISGDNKRNLKYRLKAQKCVKKSEKFGKLEKHFKS